MMCGRTCLNADEAGRQRREELQKLRSADALADHHRAIGVHAVNLKNRLRDIETDRANLAHGRLPSSGAFRRNHPMALRCRRVGAVHSINSAGEHQRASAAHVRLASKADKYRSVSVPTPLRRAAWLRPIGKSSEASE